MENCGVAAEWNGQVAFMRSAHAGDRRHFRPNRRKCPMAGMTDRVENRKRLWRGIMKAIKCACLALSVLLLAMATVSCKGPVGPAGPTGNANVTTIGFPNSAVTWTEGLYLGATSNVFAYSTALVTQDILDHGLVLGYLFNGDSWYPLPFTWDEGSTNWQRVTFSYKLNEIKLFAYTDAGSFAPSISKWKFILITDNTVAHSPGSVAKSLIESQLASAGVDIDNYLDVCAYYNLKP
jgi:hypothetical protein